jgi:KDO2-lipid IV(A) lauroyltransferase
VTASAPPRPRPRWHPPALNNAFIVNATYRGVTWLPLWLTLGIGHAGTWIAYHLMRSGTRALIENFTGMFPEMSARDRRRLALRTYRSYARDTIYFMRSLSMDDGTLRGRVTHLDTAAFDAALAAGRGAISVSPHFGNWELGGVIVGRLTSYPLAILVMREPDEGVHELRMELRRSLGIETIEVRQHLETALRVRSFLQRNGVVAILIDRHLDRDRVPVQFFGRPAYFLRTPARMAQFSGAPLVPVFVYRDETDDRFIVESGPVIEVPRGGDADASVAQATQQVATLIEAQIRKRPECWYQFYSFWAAQE